MTNVSEKLSPIIVSLVSGLFTLHKMVVAGKENKLFPRLKIMVWTKK